MYTYINPLKHFNIRSQPVGGRGGFPWEIGLIANPSFPESGDPHAVLRTDGVIVTSLSRMSIADEGQFSNRNAAMQDGIPVSGESIVVVEIDINSYDYNLQVIPRDSDDDSIFRLYKPEDAFQSDPIQEITHARFPIAAIHDNPDASLSDPPAQQYVVKQIVTTAMSLKPMCQNGITFNALSPI